MSKYHLNSAETLYQPESSGKVLLNKLGIIDLEEMEALESGLLLMMYERIFLESEPLTSLKFEHIQVWHRYWLGNVYEWAGRLRNVNLVKDGFKFAAAERIPHLICDFENRYLGRFEELKVLSRLELTCYLAECHVEFILIHPFREGNGRLSRLLFDALSVQAGTGLLDYSLWDEHRTFYFKAIQAGASGNIQPMVLLVNDILPY